MTPHNALENILCTAAVWPHASCRYATPGGSQPLHAFAAAKIGRHT